MPKECRQYKEWNFLYLQQQQHTKINWNCAGNSFWVDRRKGNSSQIRLNVLNVWCMECLEPSWGKSKLRWVFIILDALRFRSIWYRNTQTHKTYFPELWIFLWEHQNYIMVRMMWKLCVCVFESNRNHLHMKHKGNHAKAYKYLSIFFCLDRCYLLNV